MKLDIEIDGESHFNPAGKVRDRVSDNFISKQGIQLIRRGLGKTSKTQAVIAIPTAVGRSNLLFKAMQGDRSRILGTMTQGFRKGLFES